jgi:hypothetical protein
VININYDETGKALVIHINTGGGWAQVPWNPESQSIDWDSINYEPTRNSIKSAWDEWASDKDLKYELRDRPDLAPPQPEIGPDWVSVKYGFFGNAGYSRAIAQTNNQRAVSRTEIAITDYASGVNPNYPILKNLWDAIIEGLVLKPSTSEIASWNVIALTTHMKFKFDDKGKMVI